MHSPLTIVHTPYGNGSPYVPTLAERVPQDPVGGDMVTLWFLTTPGDTTMATLNEVEKVMKGAGARVDR